MNGIKILAHTRVTAKFRTYNNSDYGALLDCRPHHFFKVTVIFVANLLGQIVKATHPVNYFWAKINKIAHPVNCSYLCLGHTVAY